MHNAGKIFMICGYWKDWFCFQAKGQRVLESQQNATERQQCNCVVGNRCLRVVFLGPLVVVLPLNQIIEGTVGD